MRCIIAKPELRLSAAVCFLSHCDYECDKNLSIAAFNCVNPLLIYPTSQSSKSPGFSTSYSFSRISRRLRSLYRDVEGRTQRQECHKRLLLGPGQGAEW